MLEALLDNSGVILDPEVGGRMDKMAGWADAGTVSSDRRVPGASLDMFGQA